MSRIGKRILSIPANVSVEEKNSIITVKGPLGGLTMPLNKNITVEIKDNEITVDRLNEIKTSKQMHGTTNALINNMLIGVSDGFSRSLEIIGVGYRFQVKGNTVVINAGYSNPKELEIPNGLKVEQLSQTEIKISGIEKELVGEFAANVRSIRKPEPYKGKGIRYVGEHVRRKEGKTSK